MRKYTERDVTEYALYLHMKNNVTDFDVIFNGNRIITEIVNRYDLNGNFNHKVLQLMPLLQESLAGDSEEQLNMFIERITEKVANIYFLFIEEGCGANKESYFVFYEDGELQC